MQKSNMQENSHSSQNCQKQKYWSKQDNMQKCITTFWKLKPLFFALMA